MEKSQIRILFLYEFKLGHNAKFAAQSINRAFGEDTTSERRAQRWYEKFKSGDFSLENEDRGRPPSRLSNADLQEVLDRNPQTTCKNLSLELNVSETTVKRHLHQLGKVKKSDQYVPHELTSAQKVARLQACIGMLQRHDQCPFWKNIVTCDEKWIMYDNRRRSGAWVDACDPPLQFPKPHLHQSKVMVTVWLCARGIVHYSFLAKG